MKVIIAEKPDQAAALAKPFPHKKQKGYIDILPCSIFPKGAYMTWAVGHLLQLQAPEKYDSSWKSWKLEKLPIIPARFQYEISYGKRQQFQIIKSLLTKKEVTEIIHAGDAGREGELIIRNIIYQTGIQKKITRLWISSLTKNSIVKGFENLKEELETRPLYHEAFSRACADWLVGMNASRVLTILLKEQGISDVFSAGRVQTPTLSLIVKREEEIENFKSQPFWEVKATFSMEENEYEGTWVKENESRVNQKDLAEKIAAFCKNKQAEVTEMQTERKEYNPPLLFNLSSLQATANKRYLFSPKKTLDTLQKLYQKGIVSYPRSDSQYVTKEEALTFPDILTKLSKYNDYQSLIPTPKSSILHNPRFVNEKKVSDHYAIIPTEQVKDPSKLSADEQKIYDLVIRRLIAAHYDKAIMDYTTVTTLVDGRATFESKGKQVIQEGWRKVIFDQKEKDEDLLPPIQKGDQGNVKSVRVKEGKTQPPKRFTEGQLITLMKTAGKYIENEELEKVLRETEGLGTEATRAGIISILQDRQYIKIQKNIVYPTDKAKVLIRSLGSSILASPEMTAKWEQRLKEIGLGQAEASQFMEQVKKLCQKIISDSVTSAKAWSFQDLDTSSIKAKSKKRGKSTPFGTCPECGGGIVDKGVLFGCNQYSKTKCTFAISKTILGKRITQTAVKKLLTEGKTDKIDGFSKGERSFSAFLVWDKNSKKISFEF